MLLNGSISLRGHSSAQPGLSASHGLAKPARVLLSATCTQRRREGVMVRCQAQEEVAVKAVDIRLRETAGVLPVMFAVEWQWVRGEAVAVCGSVPAVGNWDPENAQTLLEFCPSNPDKPHQEPAYSWVGWVQLPVGKDVQFKFVALDSKRNYRFKYWLEGVNDGRNMAIKVEPGAAQAYDNCWVGVGQHEEPDARVLQRVTAPAQRG